MNTDSTRAKLELSVIWLTLTPAKRLLLLAAAKQLKAQGKLAK